MKTDIDRLHKVASGEWQGQGCGQTFLDCHHVAAALECGETSIICIIPRMRWKDHIFPMLFDVLDDHAIIIDSVNFELGEIHTNNSKIKFYSQNSLYADKQVPGDLGHHGAVVNFT